MILYIETNFVAGAAMGRDAYADALLGASPPALRLALPAVCVMEAWSVFEDERRRRNSFGNTLNSQLSQMRRDLTSVHAKALLRNLEQALTENLDLLGDIERRLRTTLEQLAGLHVGFSAAEIIPLSAATFINSIPKGLADDPTDNLILAIIQEHALQNPEEDKAFLSGNTRDFDTPEIRALLAAAGITDYFARTDAFLGWFGSRSQP